MAVEEKPNPSEPPRKFALGIAAGWIILQHRRYRRNVLFGITLVTMVLVFAGAVLLGGFLMERPMAFVLYWILCFLLVGLIFLLAVYDLLLVRKEHRQRMVALDRELSEAAKSARRLAELEKEKDATKEERNS